MTSRLYPLLGTELSSRSGFGSLRPTTTVVSRQFGTKTLSSNAVATL